MVKDNGIELFLDDLGVTASPPVTGVAYESRHQPTGGENVQFLEFTYAALCTTPKNAG
jgi:hypothetical protein